MIIDPNTDKAMGGAVSKKRASAEQVRENPSQSEQELVRVSDFESLNFKFHIENTTTKTTVKSSDDIEMVEMLPQSLVLQIPQRSCAKGHHLMLKLKLYVPGKTRVHFTFTAKVEKLEAVPESGMDKVSIAFIQYEEAEWKAICQIFEDRQNEIFNFFQGARGY
jgi:hypothetical protein